MGWCSDRRDDDAGTGVPSPTRPSERLIHHAARGTTARMQLLLAEGVHPNASKRDGTTGLHAAVANGHICAATLLLEYGANANQADRYGRAPLLDAARKGFAADEGNIASLTY